MRRPFHSRSMRVLYVALAIALSVAGAAPPAPAAPTTIGDLTDQRRALYQSELEQNLLLRAGPGYERAGRLLGWALTRGHHAYATPPDQAGHAEQSADTAIQPPARAPAPARPAQPTGQPGWLVVSLGVLAAVLALVAGLALVAARRATRRARVGQAT
jgi:hypothetical protein